MTTPPRGTDEGDKVTIAALHRLILALAERLAIVAEILGRLAERPEARRK